MTITSTTDVKENTTLDISIVNRYQVYLGKIRKSLQFTYAKQSLLLRNPGLSQTGLDRIQEILKRNFKTIVPAIKFFKLPIGFLPKNSSITHENDFLKVVSNFNFDWNLQRTCPYQANFPFKHFWPDVVLSRRHDKLVMLIDQFPCYMSAY